MVIEFPKKDVITQEELALVYFAEGGVDDMLGIIYKRLAAGAKVEPGPRKVNMRHRPIRAVDERTELVG